MNIHGALYISIFSYLKIITYIYIYVYKTISIHLYCTIIPKYTSKTYLCTMKYIQVNNGSLHVLNKRTKSCLESKRLYKQMSNIVIQCLHGKDGSSNSLYMFIFKMWICVPNKNYILRFPLQMVLRSNPYTTCVPK